MASLRKLISIGLCDTVPVTLSGWEVHHVEDIAQALRLLRSEPCDVGIIRVAPATLDATARLLRRHWQCQWIAAIHPGQLGNQSLADMIADHCHDYLTLPLHLPILSAIAGHAWGMTQLTAVPALALTQHDTIIGHSMPMQRLRAQLRRIAPVGAPVLIWGESGTGKELAAHAIHRQSPRAAQPFVPVNCGAIPAALIQSELFGHTRGAFTGAARDKAGLIESAAGGSLFLDEIGDLPRELQANLLRFLQEKTIYRLGSTRSIEVDVRIIAASHIDLEQAVRAGHFREDLFYRLNVLPVTVSPLRERGSDVMVLANHFFCQHAADKPGRLKGFSQAAQRALREHTWPGNVRELINRVRRALVLAEGRLIHPSDLGLPDAARQGHMGAAQLHDTRKLAERSAIIASLERSGGNVTHAARELAISRMTLYRQMAKHGIAS